MIYVCSTDSRETINLYFSILKIETAWKYLKLVSKIFYIPDFFRIVIHTFKFFQLLINMQKRNM
jgi:hypothetical protein